MASVRKRQWPTGKQDADGKEIKRSAWVVDYTDGGGVRRLKTFQKKKEADAFKAMSTVEIRQGVHTADSASVTDPSRNSC